MSMRAWSAVAVVLCLAARVTAECAPAGRDAFAAGLEALGRGDLAGAATRFEALVHQQPACAEARNNLAVVLVEQGRLEEAADQLRHAVEAEPNYHRARLNLERVETLLAARTPPTVIAQALPTPTDTPVVEAQAPRAPAPPPAPPANPVPRQLVALGPAGATAGGLDLAAQRVCVYRSTGAAITAQSCAPIVSLSSVPNAQWLVTSEMSARRIYLVDESGQRRLKVTSESGTGTHDVLRLRQADYDALAAQVVPWRTSWVITRDGGAAVPAAAGDQLRDALERWRGAWEQKDLVAYTSLYSSSFVPQTERDQARWRERKATLFRQPGAITVAIAAPTIVVLDDGATAVAVFEQTYRSAATASVGVKALRWRREDNRWVISAETVLTETPAPSAPGARGG